MYINQPQQDNNEYNPNIMRSPSYSDSINQLPYITQESNMDVYNPYFMSSMRQRPQSNTSQTQYDMMNQTPKNNQNAPGHPMTDQDMMKSPSMTPSMTPGTPYNNDMNFAPFTPNNTNPKMQQSMGQSGVAPSLQDMNQYLSAFLKSDISQIPFIPNPYYMLNMQQNLQPNINEMTSEESMRPMGPTGPMGHMGHMGHQHTPIFINPFFNPFFFQGQFIPGGVNPVTWLLFTSLFRDIY